MQNDRNLKFHLHYQNVDVLLGQVKMKTDTWLYAPNCNAPTQSADLPIKLKNDSHMLKKKTNHALSFP